MSGKAGEKTHIPDIIYDKTTGCSYKKGRFFGKGGFAKCYEITDQNGNVYAGKIIPKSLMTKYSHKEKITQEISIHKSLNHENIVGFHGFFDDIDNVYIILELCRKRSMVELHKRRKNLTEPEVRYYLRQILLGVMYLHNTKKIIHRDLKLGNLFLNNDLQIKLGDFGLAARIEYDGERKRTLCGTPNYIAPEILNKEGHSFEVDVWSIGCIMYTLLIGNPPFETSSLKETYSRIKRCDYILPKKSGVSKEATELITRMLQPLPQLRPSVQEIMSHNFFAGYMPKQLPISCLTMAPRFDAVSKTVNQGRKPLNPVNIIDIGNSPIRAEKKNDKIPHIASLEKDCLSSLGHLRINIRKVMTSKSNKSKPNFGLRDEMTDPEHQPLVWITKWVDYSDKYGFGYQLSDDSMGVMFNDITRLTMLANGKNVHYITTDGAEFYYTTTEYPTFLEKKMKLLNYFSRYMSEHLVRAGGNANFKECDTYSRIPYLYRWYRTSSAVVMHLTNGTLQLNFSDHTKIIMCPLMEAVTYIDAEKNFCTFLFTTIEQHGCSAGLYKALTYAYDKIKSMVEVKNHQ